MEAVGSRGIEGLRTLAGLSCHPDKGIPLCLHGCGRERLGPARSAQRRDSPPSVFPVAVWASMVLLVLGASPFNSVMDWRLARAHRGWDA